MNLFKRYEASAIKKAKRCISFLLMLTTLSGIFLPTTAFAEEIKTTLLNENGERNGAPITTVKETDPIEHIYTFTSLVETATTPSNITDFDTDKTITTKNETVTVNSSIQPMKTGDRNHTVMYVGLFLVSFGVIGFICLKIREKRDKSE